MDLQGVNMDVRNHRPLREIVYEELKKNIMTGNIVPGTRLMEVELSNQMGVSRTPIREAIRKLEKEGLVTIQPRHGAYASEISMEDMVDLLDVREELEGFSAQLAANKITPEEINRLENITDSYELAVKQNDTEQMIACDEEFHKEIVSITGNETLVKFSTMAQELALRFRYIYYDDFSRYENMPSEHRGIIAALKSGDGEKARRVVSEHIESLKVFVIESAKSGFKVQR
ncbi:MAG: GntR family transcriptional regulator [Eubacterium sp.]|nr:GntR family transcriptional regulator [Eubacterium sp.]